MAQDHHSSEPARPEPPSPHSNVGSPSTATPPPFLPLHTTVVLLVAAFIGVAMGGLMFLADRSVAKAVFTGLTITGACIVGLRKMIG
ncbi:hypothetical protein ACIBBD_28905 [Streptomyces sp. NPDC051315]|uniref:hypothetical protein n=1 Tax=Streptomyces sp. NPDC051315 TaxID=3365650 RepID=UPI003799A163